MGELFCGGFPHTSFYNAFRNAIATNRFTLVLRICAFCPIRYLCTIALMPGVVYNRRYIIRSRHSAERDWSPDEVRLIVADYFEMLRLDMLNESYNKSAHRRALFARCGRRRNRRHPVTLTNAASLDPVAIVNRERQMQGLSALLTLSGAARLVWRYRRALFSRPAQPVTSR